MAKARSLTMAEHSLSLSLSAIEVYNKPTFPSREQVFTVLMVAAWETLAKAKIVKDNRNRLSSLHIKKGRTYRRNQHGDYITITCSEAMSRCGANEVVRSNVASLERLRNEIVHLVPSQRTLQVLVHALAAASLSNYAKLIDQWFSIRVSQHNFFILPLGFQYPFTTLRAVDLSHEPQAVREIINNVIKAQDSDGDSRDGHELVLEVKVEMFSAKKRDGGADLTAKVVGEDDGADARAIAYIREFHDLYPYTYTRAMELLKGRLPNLNRNQLNALISGENIKDNEQYSGYHYRTPEMRKNQNTKGCASQYNDDFIAFADNYFRANNIGV